MLQCFGNKAKFLENDIMNFCPNMISFNFDDTTNKKKYLRGFSSAFLRWPAYWISSPVFICCLDSRYYDLPIWYLFSIFLMGHIYFFIFIDSPTEVMLKASWRAGSLSLIISSNYTLALHLIPHSAKSNPPFHQSHPSERQPGKYKCALLTGGCNIKGFFPIVYRTLSRRNSDECNYLPVIIFPGKM